MYSSRPASHRLQGCTETDRTTLAVRQTAVRALVRASAAASHRANAAAAAAADSPGKQTVTKSAVGGCCQAPKLHRSPTSASRRRWPSSRPKEQPWLRGRACRAAGEGSCRCELGHSDHAGSPTPCASARATGAWPSARDRRSSGGATGPVLPSQADGVRALLSPLSRHVSSLALHLASRFRFSSDCWSQAIDPAMAGAAVAVRRSCPQLR